jgi:uncharacterized membrane protein
VDAVLFTGGSAPTTKGIVLFVLAGVIGTVAGRFLRFMAIQRLGASIASPLNNLNPLVSTGLAILLLGEQVTLPILSGTVVIVAGATLLSMGGRQVGFRPWHLVLPILSAFCFGVVAIFRKIALNDIGAIAGTAINVTTALIVFTAFLIASSDRRALACDGRSLAYFVGAGLTENLSVFLTVVALGFGTVSVVTPLTSTSPIFMLLLSPLLLRGWSGGSDHRRHRADRARRRPDHRAGPLSGERPREDRPALWPRQRPDLEIARGIAFAAEAESPDEVDRRRLAGWIGFQSVQTQAAEDRRSRARALRASGRAGRGQRVVAEAPLRIASPTISLTFTTLHEVAGVAQDDEIAGMGRSAEPPQVGRIRRGGRGWRPRRVQASAAAPRPGSGNAPRSAAQPDRISALIGPSGRVRATTLAPAGERGRP